MLPHLTHFGSDFAILSSTSPKVGCVIASLTVYSGWEGGQWALGHLVSPCTGCFTSLAFLSGASTVRGAACRTISLTLSSCWKHTTPSLLSLSQTHSPLVVFDLIKYHYWVHRTASHTHTHHSGASGAEASTHLYDGEGGHSLSHHRECRWKLLRWLPIK